MAEMLNGDSFTTDELPYEMYELEPPTLSEIAAVLQNGMEPLFDFLKVDVASCPCLTREPYNLVGVGLCGNTAIVEFPGSTENIPWNERTRDIKSVLSASCQDSFIIGSSYATKPQMPYFGHLIMNAKYRAPENFTNASRIIFTRTDNGQRRIETLIHPNQMTYANHGSFFLSEGRTGNVIRMRARGRRMTNMDIITLMQKILSEYTGRNTTEFFGGVLRMRYGQVACNVMCDEYPGRILSFNNFFLQQQCIEITLESDLIAVGVIFNNIPLPLADQEQRYGINLYNRSEFHCFSNYGAGGQFISDTTPNTTEYEGYFNVAKKLIDVK
ncbi:PREDICTED: ester hydrolase C11orf54 homolog [Cyphomyrmex costatus]|nr:PREDICTED: ester hydrolase C11orf54 homolog [Cyphomyrmex costatus]